ncbi:MAG: hypothetical protein IJU21_04935 [Bacteroidales bacterium]|nr:hypothetical protein [Bacteroidales bacterium]
MRRKLILFTLLLAVVFPAKAQFVLTGDDPGYLRWYSIDTPYYKIIYPEGADSLAVNYGTLLEKFRPQIGLSLGFIPGEGQLRMPVVLHTHNPASNGSVAWAPRRMDLFTLPEPYGSDPTPWDIQLVAHEPRHQAQLELDRHGFIRFFSYVVGQTWTPAIFQLYLGRCLAEGDAVTAETGLTAGSRARTADFLNYYQVSLDAGQYRNWYRWRYGSYKHYTPDFYRLGYITVAGSRALYHDPLILSNALDKSRNNYFTLGTLNLQRVIRDRSGLKFKKAFPQILDYFNETWQEDAAARAPFTPSIQISVKESFPVNYQSLAELDGRLYLKRSGYLRATELGEWDGGEFRPIRPFSGSTSSLRPDPVNGRLYWSETIYHPRWTLDGKSIIRYFTPVTGKIADLTSEGRLYNPSPSPDGSRVAAVEYPLNGGSSVEVLDAQDGRLLRRIIAPDGIQASEVAWMGETLYVSGVSEGGYGIYKIGPEGNWATELAPSVQKLVDLDADGETLRWTSDLDGSNALYSYNPGSRELLQLTTTRFGSKEFCQVGDTLYSVSQTLVGQMLFSTPADSLLARRADFSKEHVYPIEDRITRQERSFRKEAVEEVEISAPKRYRKLPHLMRFHSWAPIFFDYDDISSTSMDYFYSGAAPGLTGYFQNTLGTMSGMLGFAVRPDPGQMETWRPSLHAKFKYSGLYPIIEGTFDFGDTMADITAKAKIRDGEEISYGLASGSREALQVKGSLRAYIPWSFARGGISYGVIPQISYSIANSLFDNAMRGLTITEKDPETEEIKAYEWDAGHVPEYVPMQRLGISARAYVMRPRARSQVYPRWGAGLEAGFNIRPAMERSFHPNAYVYGYAYLPGIWRTQGLRITGTYQHSLSIGNEVFQLGELAANTLPRGFSSAARLQVGRMYSWQLNASASYAIPVFVGDIALPPILYIRNFLIVPTADYTLLPGNDNLWSFGADITAEMAKFITPFDCSLGVSVSYLGGSAFEAVGQKDRWSISLIMSYDF